MKSYKRICIKDYLLEDSVGNKLELKRGHEYLTSDEDEGKVIVLTKFWVKVPTTLFAGEQKFTDNNIMHIA